MEERNLHKLEFTRIASFDNYILANMTLGLLQENLINCHLKDENIITIDPLLNPAVGGIKLMVETDSVERAQALIRQAENDFISEIPCPYCKSHSLQVEEKIDTPPTFWGKLKNQVIYGQVDLYTKSYRCQNCKCLLTELPPTF